MYAEAAELKVGVYPDEWQPQRYRVQLCARLYYDWGPANAALGELGYTPVDDDQWGRSYRHIFRNQTAELDELEDLPCFCKPMILTIRYEDLRQEDTERAEDDIRQAYNQFWRQLVAECGEIVAPLGSGQDGAPQEETGDDLHEVVCRYCPRANPCMSYQSR